MRGVEQIPWLYDRVCALGERLGLARWRRALVEGTRGDVLEIGCGTGRNLPLYGPGTRVIAFDPVLERIAGTRAGKLHNS